MHWPINQPLIGQRDKAETIGQFWQIACKLLPIYCFFAGPYNVLNGRPYVALRLASFLHLKISPGRLSCLVLTDLLNCAVIVLVGVYP